MSRYIDAEWLMKYFKRGKDYKGEYVLDDLKYDAPSKEIIRCGECKWWNCEMSGCKRNPSVVAWRDDDFCSYGEREGE